MSDELRKALTEFAVERKFRGKGLLSIALVVTQHARTYGLPLHADELITEGGGQVKGAGGGAVNAILKRHNIDRRLASEGGRTSRGSLGKMREYVGFLNDLNEQRAVDLDVIEDFWIEKVGVFFSGQPFKIKLDSSRSLRTVIRDVLAQAEERQRQAPGMQYAGVVLQHLVGAKLECALGDGKVTHNSFSTADAPGGRPGDFLLGDVAIHVTTSPGEAVIRKCQSNLDSGLRPMLVTVQKGLSAGEFLAENAGIGERLDIFEIEQFLALNLYELGAFAEAGRRTAMRDLVERYNEVIENFETDPSLRIEFRK